MAEKKASSVKLRRRKESVSETLVRSPQASGSADDFILYNPDGTIKGGTFNKVIEALTSENSSVSNVFDFLLTYRTYSKPEDLIKALKFRMSDVSQSEKDTKIARLRVINLVKQWIEKHDYDWVGNKSLERRIRRFVSTFSSYGNEYKRIEDILKKALKEKSEGVLKSYGSKIFNEQQPQSIIPSNVESLTLMDISPIEFARQLSLIEWKLWESIRPWEFLNKSWMKSDKELKAPNIVKMTHHFNFIASWVATEIIQADSLADRKAVIQKLLDIAFELKNLGNFHGLMEFISGLNNSGIYRLKETWASLDPEYVKLFEDLSFVLKSERSFKNLREILKTVNPPAIPYLGIILTDLTFILEASQDYIGGDKLFINFNKCRFVAQQIRTVIQFQQTCYNFSIVSPISNFIETGQSWTDEKIYQKSLEIEARAKKKNSTSALIVNSYNDLEKVNKDLESLFNGLKEDQSDQSVRVRLKNLSSRSITILDSNVKSATLNRSLEYLLYSDNNNFIELFVRTYQSFTTLDAIFDIVKKTCLKICEKRPHHIESYVYRSCRLFYRWGMFSDDYDHLQRIHSFVVQDLIAFLSPNSEHYPLLVNFTISTGKDKIKGSLYPAELPKPILTVTNPPTSVYQFNAEEFSRQLTLYAHSLFRKYVVLMLSDFWKPEFEPKALPGLRNMESHFKNIKNWIIKEIYYCPKKKKTLTVEVLVEISQYCLNLNDFMTPKALYLGITQVLEEEASIEISKKHKDQYEALKSLYGSDLSLLKGRVLKLKTTHPCIYPIPVLLKEIEEILSIPRNLEGKKIVINFERSRQEIDLVDKIEAYQTNIYNFSQVHPILDHINSLVPGCMKL